MPHELTNLALSEISLVGEGANEHASVVVVKARKHGQVPCDVCPSPSTCEGMGGCAADADDEASTAKGRSAEAEEEEREMPDEKLAAELAKEKARADKAEADLALLQKEKETAIGLANKLKGEVDDPLAEVLKGLPEAHRKLIEKQRAELDAVTKQADAATAALEKMRIDGEIAECIAKARDIGVADPEAIGITLHRLGKADPKEAEALEKELRSGAAARKSLQMPLGAAGVGSLRVVKAGMGEGGDDPEAELDRLAKERQQKLPGMTYAKAYDQVVAEHPDLYRVFKGRRYQQGRA